MSTKNESTSVNHLLSHLQCLEDEGPALLTVLSDHSVGAGDALPEGLPHQAELRKASAQLAPEHTITTHLGKSVASLVTRQNSIKHQLIPWGAEQVTRCTLLRQSSGGAHKQLFWCLSSI
jgi:hypothetical protein